MAISSPGERFDEMLNQYISDGSADSLAEDLSDTPIPWPVAVNAGLEQEQASDALSVWEPTYSDYDRLYDLVMNAAREQHAAAQASADRAMEFSASEAALNRAWQAEQNQKAMDFSERMSSTAYQRAMEDMSAAGLNPKLAGRLGSASTPSGVTSAGSIGQGFTAPSVAQAAISVLGSLTETYLTNANKLDAIDKDHYYEMERDLYKALYKLVPSLSASF